MLGVCSKVEYLGLEQEECCPEAGKQGPDVDWRMPAGKPTEAEPWLSSALEEGCDAMKVLAPVPAVGDHNGCKLELKERSGEEERSVTTGKSDLGKMRICGTGASTGAAVVVEVLLLMSPGRRYGAVYRVFGTRGQGIPIFMQPALRFSVMSCSLLKTASSCTTVSWKSFLMG